MPDLKQLHCHLELSDPKGPKTVLREFNTTYADGAVNTFIAVPEKPEPFCIKFCSNGYIATGIAAFVFIDGEYQCNRVRQGLIAPAKGVSPVSTDVHFIFRGQELPEGRTFKTRWWKFEALNIGAADATNAPPNIDAMGTITVMVLRCKPDPKVDFANIPKLITSREIPLRTKTAATKTKVSSTQANDDNSSVGGLGGLFDGPSDDYFRTSSRGDDGRRKSRRSERDTQDQWYSDDRDEIEPSKGPHVSKGRNRAGPERLREIFRSPDRDPSSKSPSRSSQRDYSQSHPRRHSSHSKASEHSPKHERRRSKHLAFDGTASSEGGNSWTQAPTTKNSENRPSSYRAVGFEDEIGAKPHTVKHYDPIGDRMGIWSPRSSDSYASKTGLKTHAAKHSGKAKDGFDSDSSSTTTVGVNEASRRARMRETPTEDWPSSIPESEEDTYPGALQAGLNMANPDHWEILEERATRSGRFTHPSHAISAARRGLKDSKWDEEEDSVVVGGGSGGKGKESSSKVDKPRNYSGPAFGKDSSCDTKWVPKNSISSGSTPQNDGSWGSKPGSSQIAWSKKANSIAKWTESIHPDESASNSGKRSHTSTPPGSQDGPSNNRGSQSGSTRSKNPGGSQTSHARQNRTTNDTACDPIGQGQTRGTSQHQRTSLLGKPASNNGSRNSRNSAQGKNTKLPAGNNASNQTQSASNAVEGTGVQSKDNNSSNWNNGNDQGFSPDQGNTSGWDTSNDNQNASTGQTQSNANWNDNSNTPVDQNQASNWQDSADASGDQTQNNWDSSNTTPAIPTQGDSNWDNSGATSADQNQGNAGFTNDENSQTNNNQGDQEWNANAEPAADQTQGDANWVQSEDNAAQVWDNSNNDNNTTSQASTVVPSTNDCTHPSFIPPWTTSTWHPRPSPPLHPKLHHSAPEVPLYTVAAATVAAKSVDTQVRHGPLRAWPSETARPEYMDTPARPYAVFTFQYRSRAMLEGVLGRKLEESAGEKRERLMRMSKEEVVAELMGA
ncbi:hypothetical protein EJ05DRAFT_512293 [Pseudovirgaria hyperparasitica]|uniref:Uncharacterized protein n=1 Tax=Pseudovirgaria hyperparasitica TaxID=470096 RepID=A0A6A6W3X1_9PEZI|nr:uncharacterized protein EJ05DRAFT_512293 [Pseudovirgaria hyperparasitica]KAF2756666.1 hypothetical protein EJ05DRAFT_512293 [Pseudovirgaria hyperparasitica]